MTDRPTEPTRSSIDMLPKMIGSNCCGCRSARNGISQGKAYAFSAGHARLSDLHYDVIANLDADITFESDYFAFLLQKLVSNPELGVVGTPYVEKTEKSSITNSPASNTSPAHARFFAGNAMRLSAVIDR